MKPRVVPPSPEGGPSPKPAASTESPKRELRPAAVPSPETAPTISDRFFRAARYHSIWLGRGAHHVRRHLQRVRTPQAVQGLVGSLRGRWWPNSAAAKGEAGTGKRLGFPAAFPRRLVGPAPAAGAEGSVKKHSTHRMAWDFAVVTAAVAVLLVLHHQFKRPHHRTASPVIASADAGPDQSTKKRSHKRRSHSHSQTVAVAERPTDTVRDSGPLPTHTDPAAALSQQTEPAPSQNSTSPPDSAKRDDWSSPASTSQPPSTSAIAGNAEPPQTAVSDRKMDQPQDSLKFDPKDAGPALAGGDHADAAAPAPGVDSSTQPPKHRRRRHTPEPAVASTTDTGFPNFNDAPAGPSDSAHKSESPSALTPPTAEKTPPTATADFPPLDRPKSDKAAALEEKHSAEKPAAPPTGPDIFGSLQDPPAEKHELKEHDIKESDKALLSAGDAAAKPADEAPPKRRRRRKTSPAEVASDNPLHPAAPTAANEPVPDAILHDALKAEDAKKPLDAPKGPEFSPKKDEFAPPVAADDLPHKDREKEKKVLAEPKLVGEEHKPAVAADHDAFGPLKDAAPEKHDAPEVKPAEPPLNIAGDTPPAPETHRRRRRRNPAATETPAPGPTLAAEPSPSNLAPSGAKPEVKTPSDALPTLGEPPKPVASASPKVDLKPAELKPAEVSALPGPSLSGNLPPAQSEPKPEKIAAVPATVPTANPPANSLTGVNPPAANGPVNLVPKPAVDEESQQAALSFARRMPEKTDAASPLTYKIVVRNNGPKPVKLIEVDEAVPADRTVQLTEPLAETHDQTLHWSLHNLGPHEERAVAITLAAVPAPPPAAVQPILRTAAIPKAERLDVEPQNTAKVEEPEKVPHLRLELIVPTTLQTGETCRIGFRATNLGPKSAPLVLNLDLPPEIHFQRGQALQYKVGGLDENESREDYLSAVAKRPGVVEIQAELLLDGRSIVSTKATCRITGASTELQGARAKRDPLVVPAGATQAAPAAAAPCNCGQ